MDKEQKNFYSAATWGIWFWIACFVVPALVIVLCCFGCFGFSVIGQATEGVQ